MGATQSIASAATAIMASLIYDGNVRNVVIIMSLLGLVTVLLFLIRSLVLGDQPLYVAEDRPG
jgi:hypothetical protein